MLSFITDLFASDKQADQFEKGSKAEAEYLNRALDLQERMYEEGRQDIRPWLTGGERSLSQLMRLQGIDMPYSPGEGKYYDELQGLDEQIYNLGQELGVDPYNLDEPAKDLTALSAPQPEVQRSGLSGLYGRSRSANPYGDGFFGKAAQQAQEGQDDERINELRDLIKRKQYLEGRITPQESSREDIYKLMEESPDYQFALDQGRKQIGLNMLARGAQGGASHKRALTELGQGLATQTLDNYRRSLMGLSGTGQSTGVQGAQLGLSSAGQMGRTLGDIGAARKSGYQAKGQGYMNMANAFSNQMENIAGLAGLAF